MTIDLSQYSVEPLRPNMESIARESWNLVKGMDSDTSKLHPSVLLKKEIIKRLGEEYKGERSFMVSSVVDKPLEGHILDEVKISWNEDQTICTVHLKNVPVDADGKRILDQLSQDHTKFKEEQEKMVGAILFECALAYGYENVAAMQKDHPAGMLHLVDKLASYDKTNPFIHPENISEEKLFFVNRWLRFGNFLRQYVTDCRDQGRVEYLGHGVPPKEPRIISLLSIPEMTVAELFNRMQEAGWGKYELTPAELGQGKLDYFGH